MSDQSYAERMVDKVASSVYQTPNKVLDTGSPHWYVSYNTGSYFDYGCVTTALVLGQVEYCLVLKGDHRQQFQEILDMPFKQMKGRSRLALCLAYVRDHRDQLHEYSDEI